MTIPFCDYLNVSVPLDHIDDVTASLLPVFDAASFDIVADDRGGHIYRFETGTVRFHRRSMVVVVGASGGALNGLRAAGVYGEYLSCLGAVPHRVTRLDCTIDVACDAAPVVAELAARGQAGHVALSRKAVAPGDVSTYLSLDDRATRTGSVYFGRHTAEVRGVVYDKRWQLLDKYSQDIGPCTRYEIRVSGKFGATLADAWSPSKLFWHFAAPAFLPAPAGTMAWAPHAEGFTLPPRTDLTPAQLMQRRLEASPDVARLLALAAQCGPGGLDLLCTRLRKLAKITAVGRTLSADLAAASGLISAPASLDRH